MVVIQALLFQALVTFLDLTVFQDYSKRYKKN
jgi:hypothetical protein